MRAQITGLEGAKKNAKDGISLVQTAEGALTEVHSMLNRMYDLAEQSANGTYDNTTDRAQLQKEVEALRTEINRVADSANFNGIKLLDGSLSGKSQVDGLSITESTAIKGKYTNGGFAASLALANTAGSKLKNEDIGKTIDYTVTWKDANGTQRSTTAKMTFLGDDDKENGPSVSTTPNKNYFMDASGKKYTLNTDGQLTASDLAQGMMAGLRNDEEFAAAFEISEASSVLTFEAKIAGTEGAKVTGLSMDTNLSLARTGAIATAATSLTSEALKETTQAYSAMQKFDATAVQIGTNTETKAELSKKIFTIDGHRFLVGNALTDAQIKSLDDDVTHIKVAVTTLAATQASTLSAEINRVTGLNTYTLTTVDNADTKITAGTDILFGTDRLKLTGSDLTLQIGDTADEWNQMSVKIEDMHTTSMGIEYVSIADAESASDAMAKIKDAINYVSNTRGTLGATQNRLDHTINNISVMTENIQDAESTIRDTDVADEMMKYTKNSILVQSAQAMLAQANQQPQGVLQLLQ